MQDILNELDNLSRFIAENPEPNRYPVDMKINQMSKPFLNYQGCNNIMLKIHAHLQRLREELEGQIDSETLEQLSDDELDCVLESYSVRIRKLNKLLAIVNSKINELQRLDEY